MLKTAVTSENSAENRFLHLYKMVQERENFLNTDAKVVQYSAILRFFMKFLQQNETYTSNVSSVLFWTYVKLGDIYYDDGLQNQDNTRYFLAVEYYNQALSYARTPEDKSRVLLALKDIYYYVNDEDALIRVEETWAENHNKEEKFAAYMLLAGNAESPLVKARFLEKALDEVMGQDENFYAKYQDTLNICSQLLAIYELQGEKEKAIRIKKLRENTLKLLN
ncbi:MAG: hypothetical protein NC218_00255 [Acetobacter sp.]|nr:hypothetical protein [Acetobacter sp.]